MIFILNYIAALKWFESFLCGRCQKVRIGDNESVEIVIKFGVTQGSVLGPVLFNIYIRSLYATTGPLKFLIQGFADDHQIYKAFCRNNEYQVLANDLPIVFQQIDQWMADHYLQLNPGKTEIIVFGTPKLLNKLHIKVVL